MERLVAALAEIKRRYAKDKSRIFVHEYINPQVVLAPQKAFYALKKKMPISDSAGYVSSEFVMCYPPGIPILAPGERITEEILNFIDYAKEKGCFLTGTEDSNTENINVLKEYML